MCGIEGHGFYWAIESELKELDYEVVFGLEVNSHSSQRDKYNIPSNAKRLGFNPVNGEIISNDPEPIPAKVIEKASFLFEAYFPNKEAIAGHIKGNYAKNNDKEEWDMKLPSMLRNNGKGLFSKKYCEQWIKDCEQGIKNCERWIKEYKQKIKYYEQEIKGCEQRIKDCKQWIKDYEQRIEYYEQEIEGCEQWIKYCEQRIKYYGQEIKDCTGTLDKMNIDIFIEYFLQHPNDYWAGRNRPIEVEYKELVKA